MAKKRGGEGSNLGLIITLVFFVLSTVILGVTTYMGFSDQEKMKAETTKSKADADEQKNRADWYRFQARLYRIWSNDMPVLGKDAGDAKVGLTALVEEKKQFDTGALPYAGKQSDLEEVKGFFGKLNTRMPWQPGMDAPSSNWVKEVEDRDKLIASREKTIADNNAKLAKLDKEKAELIEEHEKAIATLTKQLKDTRATVEADLKKDFAIAAKQEVRKELEAESKIMTQLRVDLKKMTDERDKSDKALAKLQKTHELMSKDLRLTRKQYDETKTVLTALAEKHGEDVGTLRDSTRDITATRKLKDWDKDWQIITIDRTGKMPYINLGSADGLLPQVSFSIHAATGVAGRKLNEIPKGTLEVVRVIGPHLAQARLTSVRDEKKDPILRGDFIFNASWDPNRRKQVALAGLPDLGTDGADNTEDFRRLLARQRVDLVAWVDSKDEKEPKIKTSGEGLSKDTEYLVLGEKLTGSKHPKGRGKYAEEYDKLRTKLVEEAKEIGITVISMNKYLEMIGYRPPKLSSTGGY